ncbi:MAG: alpha-L-fucosidase [Fluviicola sp.]
MKNKSILFVLLCSSLTAFSQNKEYVPDSSKVIQERIEEWQDLKFGLLMHWGTYSQWGIVESWSICPEDLSWAAHARKKGQPQSYAEYVQAYENLQTTLNPVNFDPAKWSKAAKNAGMKYLVFTTKHHDGFCMFDTDLTDYKITDPKTPFSSHPKSNITKEVFSAFRSDSLWIGAYFSKPDWHSDDYWWDFFPVSDRNCNYAVQKYPEKWQKFTDFTHGQIDELMTEYGKVDILWLDGGWVRPKDSLEVLETLTDVYEGSRWARNPQSQDINMPLLVKNAREKQPELIVVDRAVPGPYQNYLTPEQHIPANGLPYPWETCMTMATSWSYVPNDVYKSSDELITNLVDVVSKGGNFLLNVGPTPDGSLDSAAYNRLEDIGNWMDVNQEAIYGTRMFNVFGEENGIRYTRTKDKKTVYIFFPDVENKSVTLDQFNFQTGMKAVVLGTKSSVKCTKENGKLHLQLPKKMKSMGKYMWVVKVTLP